MTNTSPNPWHTSGFLANLILACSANYSPKHPFPFSGAAGVKGATPIATAGPTLRALIFLRHDLIQDARAIRDAANFDQSPMATLKGILSGGNDDLAGIGEKMVRSGQLMQEHAMYREELEVLGRQLRLVENILGAFANATVEALRNGNYSGTALGENDILFAVQEEGGGPSFSLPFDHPLVKMGEKIVLIIAGEDRSPVLGLPDDAALFSGESRSLMGPVVETDSLDGRPEVARIEGDEGVLLRLAALVKVIAETPFIEGANLALSDLQRVEGAASEASTQLILVHDIFWALTRERYELPKGGRLALRGVDAAIVELPGNSFVKTFAEFASAAFREPPTSDRGCGDPDCEVCG